MHTQAYWGELFEQRKRVLASRLFAATITWELNRYHDIEVAYYRAKAALSDVRAEMEACQ